MKSRKARDLIQLLIGIALVVVVNVIAQYVPARADLTSEKRYSLTESTKELVAGLEDPIYVKMYLHGNLPADLLRLSTATRDLLEELKAYAPDKIDFEFVDPSASPDEKTDQEVYTQLTEAGLQYSSIRTRENGSQTEQIYFPGALLHYRGKSAPVQLLKTQMRMADAGMVNRSINNLEYELALAMRQLTGDDRKSIAFLQGHGEADEMELGDITAALKEQYDVGSIAIEGQLNSLSFKPDASKYRLNRFDLVIVAGPDSTFSERDLLILDQFIMGGGKVIWCVDPMNAHLDSLRTNQMSVATPLNTGLDEMLFAYGARLNKNLLLDKSCGFIEIYTTPMGNQPKLERLPWYFEPVIIPQGSHPIVSNLDPIHTKFVSSVDPIDTDSVKHTVLLRSSSNSRALNNPVRISLNIVDFDPKFEESTTKNAPVAVLLEGKFTSAFKDRFKPFNEDVVKKEMGYRENGKRSSMLVISDGDVIQNRVNRKEGMYYALGYDRLARRKIYGNREFLVNAINYMLDDKSLISVRSRTITLRKLDEQKVQQDERFWKVFNMSAPLAIVVLIGGATFLYRKKRFSKAAK